jgi:hypothetical protein
MGENKKGENGCAGLALLLCWQINHHVIVTNSLIDGPMPLHGLIEDNKLSHPHG